MNLRFFFVKYEKSLIFILISLSALFMVLANLQAVNAPFAYDDVVYIPENAKLIGLPSTELWKLFTEPYNNFLEFLPLRDFSYWLDIALFGQSPAVFRIHSLVLYILCLPLVYFVTLKLWGYFQTGSQANASWPAAAVTILFALHPTLVEPVIWIGGRKDIQAALFSLISLGCALVAKRSSGLSPFYALLTCIALIAAMFSKATAVAVAPVIAILWLCFWFDIKKTNPHHVMLFWIGAILLIAVGIAKVFAMIITTKVPLYFGIEAVTRSLSILGWLSRLSISPENRQVFYPVFEYPYFSMMVVLGLIVLITGAIFALFMLRRRSLEGAALIAFLIFCLPSLQLIPYMPPSLVSDRFITLAVWPVMIFVVALLWRFRPAIRIVILVVVSCCWGWQNVSRASEWRSFESVIDANLRAYPECYMANYFKITDFLLKQEKYPAALKTAEGISMPELQQLMVKMIAVDQAIYDFLARDAVTANSLLWQLGVVLNHYPYQSQWDSPLKVLWEMSQIALSNEWITLAKRFPDDVMVRYSYGRWLLSVPKYDMAINVFREVIESNQLPLSLRGSGFKYLGMAMMNSGHTNEAEDALNAALEQSPPDLQANCLLGELYQKNGHLTQAKRALLACH